MLIDHKHKLFFIGAQKIGTHTLGKTFKDGQWIIGMHGRMSNIFNKEKELYDKILSEYTKYCVVRNPWSHAVSQYFHDIDIERLTKTVKSEEKLQKYSTFESYILNKLYKHQEFYTFDDDKFVCDYFIRFENLDGELQKICIDNNIQYHKFHLNKNNERSFHFDKTYPNTYKELYNQELIYKIGLISKTIIDKFKYVYE